MTIRHFFTFMGIVSALALVPAAQAANLFINDSVEAQITLTQDANWEGGVLSNGMPFGSRVGGSTTAPGESATFSGTWRVNSRGNPDPGTGIIYFVDQAVNNHSCHRRHHDDDDHTSSWSSSSSSSFTRSASPPCDPTQARPRGRSSTTRFRRSGPQAPQECLCQRHRHRQLEHCRWDSEHLFHDLFERMWPEPGSVASTLRRPRSSRPDQPHSDRWAIP